MLLDIYEPGQTPLPHAEETTAVGIDLGTTNTVVAVKRGDGVEVLRGEDGSALLPSVIDYNGQKIRSVKRLMKNAGIRIQTPTGQVSPVEVSADILKKAVARAEKALGQEVTRAVITVPAYFDDAARAATKAAAAIAGLEVLRLLAEPTAAAVAYGLDKGVTGLYAVYDLGGGTFDFSLLKLDQGIFRVLATGGDTELGGDDFDKLLAGHLSTSASPLIAGISDGDELLLKARQIKEDICSGVDCGNLRQEFDILIAPLVARTLEIAAGALADAKINKDQVQGVVMVGGSTRVPLVLREVEKFFGKPPLCDINPDEAVARGAAIQADGLTTGSSNLLLDVTPLSLGLETMGGIVEKIIYRNTPIPASSSQEFTTYQDNQNGMVIHVLQGERELVRDCRSLARFELQGIPALPAGVARVKVVFTVDADGLLAVTAREQSTGAVQSIEVKPSFGLSLDEIGEMLRKSHANAANDMQERLLLETRSECERAILALEGAINRHNELIEQSERETLSQAIHTLRDKIRGADREEMQKALKSMEEKAEIFAGRIMDAGIKNAITGHNVADLALDIANAKV